jgi:hypothetical protein
VSGGKISWGSYLVGVGDEFSGQKLLVVARDEELSVFGQAGLVRRLRIDPSRRYQGSGRPPGRRPKRTVGPCG